LVVDCEVSGYSTREVADLLGVTPSKVRAFARAGFVATPRESRRYRFSFQDIVLLRAAKALEEASIPARRVRRALRALREALPEHRPLSGLRIVAAGDTVVVQDAQLAWQPETGQATFDFDLEELTRRAAPVVHAAAARAEEEESPDWYAVALDLETVGAIDEALEAYERTLALDPGHVQAHINAGRLHHAQGRLADAEMHYRNALRAEPANATALFNLGVALEDGRRFDEAIEAYAAAVAADPAAADAHFNLARLYEQCGDKPAAIRHFARYRALVK
jgi:tetratricopeptide (TPR) repeat protein